MHDNKLTAAAPHALSDGTGDSGIISALGDDEFDPNLLLEALDGDFEGLGLPSLSPAVLDPNTVFGETKRKRRKQLRPNKAREERRFQVEQLRKEVEDLELTLKQWQERRRRLPANSNKANEFANHREISDVPAVWEDICKNQLCRRLKAERENIRLKNQYNEEMQVVKKVEKLLYKRNIQRNAMQSNVTKLIRRTNLPPGYIQRMAAALFEELSAGIEICYLLNESVLGANTTVPTSMASRMPLLRGGLKGEERTLFDRRILPFRMHNISEAWWRDWHNYKGHKETPGDVVVESFGLEMSDFKTNTSVLSYGQQILRRDIEDDQIVFVWNAYLEPFIYDNEQVGGIYFLEQCHMIIKPEAEDTTTNEDELASCMSSCYVITPYFLDSTLEKDPRIAALVDFLVGALFFHMKAQNDTVEDLLLEQALQSRTCTNK
ncbi:hypothetical protein L917_13294 [Phytophthora nicotianae]|uniref:Uncharacterized protein n=1 Tax=Phytophthora nicotianae TaxID=4792 RepID=W2KT71_PHYNI|nr:hypothetical protein L917_13294 [Phytophthora nicotianae]